MAKQNINVGTSANDKKGDSLRAAFQKVNANFTELYEAVGLAAAADQDTTLTFLGSTISTDDSSGIVIDRATTVSSNLSVGGDILPSVANGGDLGSSTLPWRSLYVSNNTIYIGGTAVGVDANGNLTVNGGQVNTPSNTLVNGANTVSLGSDGVLTLPGGRTRIGTAVGVDAIIANEDTAFGVVTQGTNGTVQLVWIEDSENFGTSNLAAVYVNSGGPGSVRIATGANGGPGPEFWEFKNSGALTFPQGTTIATADGTEAFLIDGAVDKDVQIYTYSGETAHGWTFGTDGDLIIPGDIKSNSNINIDINLADSTLRRWQFGEDGKLTFPDGANYAGQTVTMPTTTIGNTNSFVWEFSDLAIGIDRITLNWNLLASDTAGFYIGTTHSTNGKYLFLNGTDQSLSYFAGGVDGGGKLIFGSSAGNNAGDANAIEIKAASGDVYLTSTESVKITVDASDSSARIWTFDPTGELTFPDSTVQSTAFTGNATALVNGSYSISAAYNGIDIKAPLTWKEFDTDRVVLNYNGTENGFVIGTNVTGVTQGWFFYNNGRTKFPTATAPAHSYGAAGDVAGTVAFDGSYIYYCTANYVNNSTNIWKRVALDATPW